MLRIGIPRALLYYRYYPMWKAFFEQLDAEVIVSPTTTKDMVAVGFSRLAEETCLPLKVLCGHVLSLVDKCDHIFIPSVHSIERNVYNCPKLIASADIIRATVPEAPILDPDINVSGGKRSVNQSIHKLGRLFTANSGKIKRALERATEVQREYQGLMHTQGLTPPQAIGKMFHGDEPEGDGSGYITIALIGHPYLLYDEYINHRLITRLQGLGVKVLTPEMVAEEELRSSLLWLVARPKWSYEDDVVGAGGYYLYSDVDGVIYIVAFGCGPDSTMMEVLQHEARASEKPFLPLVLDQHTSDTGVITRLEAFTDMLQRQEKASSFTATPLAKVESEREGKINAMSMPNFAHMPAAFRASVRMFSIDLISPPITKRTLTLGTRYSPEFICLPFKMMLGNYIEALEQGADTLLYIESEFKPCRLGYYAQIMEQTLCDLGYEFRWIVYSGADKNPVTFFKALKSFTNNAPWSKILSAFHLGVAKLKALDDMERAVHHFRAVELEKGTANRIFNEGIQAIDDAPNISSLKQMVREYDEKLTQIPQIPNFVPLKVRILGEPVVILESFSNMDLEAEVGKLGVEVSRTRSNYYSEWLKLSAFFNALNVDKKKLRKYAYPYLKRDPGGHAIESIGDKVYRGKEYDGIIHVVPFTCMPEIVAQNIMPSIKENDTPVLVVTCDEQTGKGGMVTRLEAFIDLLEWRRKKRS